MLNYYTASIWTRYCRQRQINM